MDKAAAYMHVLAGTADTSFCDCGRTLYSVPGEDYWWHLAADGMLVRGCRAASFDPADGWDPDIKRNRTARPGEREQVVTV